MTNLAVRTNKHNPREDKQTQQEDLAKVRNKGQLNNAFSLSNITKVYNKDQAALSGLNVSVNEGEFAFVAGSSGAGKSTFLRILLGEERPTTGEGVVLGRNLRNLNSFARTQLRQDIGVIFQDYKLIQSKTILENVAYVLELRSIAKVAREKVSYQILASLGLRDKVHQFPPSLSGGEQQRVAVARALITKPKLILADEPTGNLDPDMTYAVFNLLLEANNCGSTVIVASHNIPLIEELNRRTLVLDKGKLIGDFSKVRQ